MIYALRLLFFLVINIIVIIGYIRLEKNIAICLGFLHFLIIYLYALISQVTVENYNYCVQNALYNLKNSFREDTLSDAEAILLTTYRNSGDNKYGIEFFTRRASVEVPKLTKYTPNQISDLVDTAYNKAAK